MTEDPQGGLMDGRAVRVVFVGLVVVATAGFFAGTRNAPDLHGYTESPDSTPGSVPTAVPQAEMESLRYGARIAQHAAALEAMGATGAEGDEREAPSPEERAASLAERAEHRAYDGAPPTIPHPIDTHGAPTCLSCHGEGARIGDRVAPVMSHQSYVSCVQCHAAEDGLPFEQALTGTMAEANAFVGQPAPEGGQRAWPAAPPTIPHRTFMRERCVSCHGAWATGLASSHPWRQSCTQCHAPSAELDQRPESSLPPLEGL